MVALNLKILKVKKIGAENLKPGVTGEGGGRGGAFAVVFVGFLCFGLFFFN